MILDKISPAGPIDACIIGSWNSLRRPSEFNERHINLISSMFAPQPSRGRRINAAIKDQLRLQLNIIAHGYRFLESFSDVPDQSKTKISVRNDWTTIKRELKKPSPDMSRVTRLVTQLDPIARDFIRAMRKFIRGFPGTTRERILSLPDNAHCQINLAIKLACLIEFPMPNPNLTLSIRCRGATRKFHYAFILTLKTFFEQQIGDPATSQAKKTRFMEFVQAIIKPMGLTITENEVIAALRHRPQFTTRSSAS